MPTSGGGYIPITASRKQISREIKQLMGNGEWQAAFLTAHQAGTGRRQPELETQWERFEPQQSQIHHMAQLTLCLSLRMMSCLHMDVHMLLCLFTTWGLLKWQLVQGWKKL